jgi:RHS repeat-associated protein
LTWDPEGELAAVVTGGDGAEGDGTPAAGDAEYVYSADGDRIVRTDSTGTTVYLPGGQEVHVDAEGVVSATRYYGFAGQSVAVRQGKGLQGVSSLVCDPHGTALAAVANTTWTRDSVVRQYTDPFGAARGPDAEAVMDDMPGDRQFLGKTRDGHTGLTLLGARWYDESSGQFLSTDPVLEPGVPAQFNAYLYSGNNPLTWADPSGMSWLSDGWNSAKKAVTKGSFWSGAVVGAIVGGIAGVAVFAACTAATGGLGVAGCAVAGIVVGGMVAGAVGSLVANAHATAFEGQRHKSSRELAGEAGVGAVVGGVTAGVGRLFAPMASRLAGSVASASRSIAPKASFAQRLATAQRASAAQAAERAQAASLSEAVTNLRTAGTTGANTARSTDDLLPGLPDTAPVPLGRGSTGRTVPGDLVERLAMTEARSNPGGSVLNMRDPMGDARWPGSDGWVKMSQKVNGIDIHYVRNTVTGEVDDFKFKNPFNPLVLVQPGRSIVG